MGTIWSFLGTMYIRGWPIDTWATKAWRWDDPWLEATSWEQWKLWQPWWILLGGSPPLYYVPKFQNLPALMFLKAVFAQVSQTRVFHSLGASWDMNAPHPSPMYLNTWSQLVLLCWAAVRTFGNREVAGRGVSLAEGREGYFRFLSKLFALCSAKMWGVAALCFYDYPAFPVLIGWNSEPK